MRHNYSLMRQLNTTKTNRQKRAEAQGYFISIMVGATLAFLTVAALILTEAIIWIGFAAES